MRVIHSHPARMSQAPRSFHAAHAPAREAPAPAPAPTLGDVAAAAAAALAQDPEVNEWNWWEHWKRYMDEQGSDWADSSESVWLSALYRDRIYRTPRDMAHTVMHDGPARVTCLLPRMTDGELAECRVYMGRMGISPVIRSLVKAEVRRRATPAELQAMKELVPIDQSNVMSTLQMRLARGLHGHVASFFAEPPVPQNRVIPVAQRLRQIIDILRGSHHDAVVLARKCIVEFIRLGANRETTMTWDGMIAHLTILELAEVHRLLQATRGRADWMLDWMNMADYYQFRERFLQSYEDIRIQRAHLAASLLIQRLARRDAGAANYLSSVITRTVDLRRPHTHIASEPRKRHLAYMRRAALSKRKDQMEAGEAVAANTRQKSAAAAEERKHDED